MIRSLKYAVAATALMALAACGDGGGAGGSPSGTRSGIWAAGSSTVFPFATRVAETFARTSGGAAPRVESLGTGGGIQAFCQGVGPNTPDIANASRQMKQSEFDLCAKNGVKDIVEIKIGFDGIVIATARNGNGFNFELNDLYEGLAKEVPGPNGTFVANPAKTWNQVNAGLPNQRIQVYGPPPTSGTRDAWIELAIEGGAAKLPTLAKMKTADEKKFKATVSPMRTDGGWVDAGENDNAIVGTIEKTPNALGVFGYSFLEENGSRIKGATINGVKPTAQTIASGQYPLSRSLYIYVKKSQVGVTPGLKEFVAEFVSDAATGRGGYLQNRGMIPLPPAVHVQMKQKASALTPMPAPKN